MDVVVVDHDPDERLRGQAERAGALVIQGDMRQLETLAQAHLDEARAIILATSDDLLNIGALFDIQRVNPRVRVVFRLSHEQLALQLSAALPHTIGLAVPELAAPALVFAAGSALVNRALRIPGASWAMATVDPRRTPLRFRDGSPLLLLHAASPSGSCPLPGSVPDNATEVTFAGQWESVLEALGAPAPWPHWQPGLPRRIAAAVSSVRRAFWVVTLIAIFFIAFNSALFSYELGISVTDAIYFVTTTLTTVGYGDISLIKASDPFKLYASGLMLFGTLMTAVLFGLVTEHVIGQRLENVMQARPLPKVGHIVVIGLGTIGFHAVTVLRKLGAPVSVVDRGTDGGLAQRVRAMGVPVLEGDAQSPLTLAAARVDKANCVLVVTSEDMVNLAIALAIRERNPGKHVVLRLFDQELAARVYTALGLGATRSTSTLASSTIAAHAVFGLAALDAMLLGGKPYVVWSTIVSSAGHGTSIAEFVPSRHRVVKLQHNGTDVVLPPMATLLHDGDRLTSIVPAEDVEMLDQLSFPFPEAGR